MDLPKIKDDLENNHIRIIEKYSIEKFWSFSIQIPDDMNIFHYEPLNIGSYITAMNCEKKEYPVYVNYPNRYKQVTTLHLPQDLAISDTKQNFLNKAYNFDLNIKKVQSSIVQIDYAFETLTNEIAPTDFLEVCNQSNNIIQNLALTISYPIPKH